MRYHELVLEITRKCNMNCTGYCMRGLKQNIDINTDFIDMLFNNDISSVDVLYFSGGEPTINSDAIVYTINKIIEEKLPVTSVGLITNGKFYSKETVDAFEKFNEYANSQYLEKLSNNKKLSSKTKKRLYDAVYNKWATISFSDDQYHDYINQSVINEYQKSKTIQFSKTGNKEDSSLLYSGFSKAGRNLSINQNNIRVFSDFVLDMIYLTAKGNLSVFGDGSFDYLDKYSDGNFVGDVKLDDFVMKHLSPSSVLDTSKDSEKQKRKIKRKFFV